MKKWMAIPALAGTLVLGGIVLTTAAVNAENDATTKSESTVSIENGNAKSGLPVDDSFEYHLTIDTILDYLNN